MEATAYDLMKPGEFRTWPISDRLAAAPAMLHPSERRAISYFAGKAYQFCRIEGLFVDAGSFAGGSLVAAIEGVERVAPSLDAVGKRFIAYDLFKANEYMIEKYPDHFSGRKLGEDFLDIFYKVIGDYRRGSRSTRAISSTHRASMAALHFSSSTFCGPGRRMRSLSKSCIPV